MLVPSRRAPLTCGFLISALPGKNAPQGGVLIACARRVPDATQCVAFNRGPSSPLRGSHTSPPTQRKTPHKGAFSLRAPGGIRTPNLLIRSQMLYPLSYGRSVGRLRENQPVQHNSTAQKRLNSGGEATAEEEVLRDRRRGHPLRSPSLQRYASQSGHQWSS